MPKAYLFMGYFVILISLGILILPRLMENPPEYYHPLIWILILTIFLFGLYIIRLYSIHKINIKKNEFVINSTFNRKKKFKVDKIKSLNINFFTYFITIKDENDNKGKVYFHLIGLIELLERIETQSRIDASKIKRVLKI
ncbi:hypothetical protein [uncultured Maribacter sp.]|uniref:hypothetical protein n=1 Tax=uncultured Maribacter sp. TaxID=431308 RepID=UPI002609C603|nr:hypothetical protein [uncultured Maribacter sp.]